MSKFLKFIVHFIVICTIVCVVGLAVPPFLGITTEIMDDSGKETNLPMGSVTYAIPVKIKEAAVGDSILYQTDSKAYRYMITEMDKKNHIFKVIDSSDKDAEPVAVEVKDYIPKVVITVGYAGYLLLATESIEGLIILGLAVLFLVILYIVAELLKKEPQDDYDETDTEPGYVKSKKELKREEKAREKRYKEEERQIKKEERARRKGKAPERKKIKTGGFVDEIYEDELEPVKPAQPETIQTATSEAHELLRKEIAAATADVPVKQEESVQTKPDAGDIHMEPVSGKTEVIVPQVKEQLKQMMNASDRKPVEAEETEGNAQEEIRRMVIPTWSAAQIAETARSQGDAPDIVRDDVTKVTLFDYSDIIADEKPVYPVTFEIFPAAAGSETTFSLYEDAGTDLGYLRGEFMRTPITCQTTDKGYTLKVGTRTGEKYSLPGQRNLMFCIYTEQMPKTALLDGQKIKKTNVGKLEENRETEFTITTWCPDKKLGTCLLRLPDDGKEHIIEFIY